MRINCRGRLAIAALACWFGTNLSAFTFKPSDAASLIEAIHTANANGENDIIDLNGLIFVLSAPTPTEIDPNGLPPILADGGHTLLIRNGVIERDSKAAAFRFLELSTGSSLSLDKLRLRNGLAPKGQSGGAILVNSGAILDTINDCTFKSNASPLDGGAIALLLGAKLNSVSDSTFTGNLSLGDGGALALVSAHVTDKIIDSTFDNNKALNGGAISVVSMQSDEAKLNAIINVTISNNTAQHNGGALFVNAQGDGKSIISGLRNSTIASNTGASGGGIYLSDQTGIEISSSIIALNKAESGSDLFDAALKAIIKESYNFIGNNSSSAFTAGMPNTNESFVGDVKNPLDPKLGPLQINGGSTQTRALLTGSDAIDRGDNPLNLIFNQQGSGYARTSNGRTDIGAFELQVCIYGDTDNDKVCDELDNCPFVSNPDQYNSDGDNVGEACDFCPGPNIDSDKDGACDVADRCPGYDDSVDPDADGHATGCDNCPELANANQQDSDGDGIGNACDTTPDLPKESTTLEPEDKSDTPDEALEDEHEEELDDDKDGISNEEDKCAGFDDALDANKNGQPDGCEESQGHGNKKSTPEEAKPISKNDSGAANGFAGPEVFLPRSGSSDMDAVASEEGEEAEAAEEAPRMPTPRDGESSVDVITREDVPVVVFGGMDEQSSFGCSVAQNADQTGNYFFPLLLLLIARLRLYVLSKKKST